MYKVSQRIQDLPVSAVRKLTPYALAAKKEGVKVYHLNIGDPDIKTPKVMLDVLKNWDLETIRYAQSSGEPDLIQALKSYYHNLGFKCIKEEDILITVGGSEGVVMSLFAVGSPGDEILVFEPFYSNYSSCAHFVGVKLVPVPTSIENGFHLPVKNAEDFAIFLLSKFRLNNETVMLAPGAGFYGTKDQGLNQVRIAYVLQVKDLQKCIMIIDKALKAYHSE